MPTLHGEIPCPHLIIHNHGTRRRRCFQCGRTWTKWKRRRGRRPRPRRFKRLKATFFQGLTITQQAQRAGINRSTFTVRHRAVLTTFSRTPSHSRVPRGKLILVIDGLWWRFDKERWVLYLMGVRPLKSTTLTYLPPILQPGHESQERWREVLETLPETIQSRIVALISDDFRGAETLAKDYRWVFQLCHFHLLSYLQTIRGVNKRVIFGWHIRQKAYRLICLALATPSPQAVKRYMAQLQALAVHPGCPLKWKGRIRRFLRALPLYRAYRKYPHLNLPTTTNAIESLNSRIRELARRSRGFRTPQALEAWVKAYLRFHPTGRCNGKIQQN